MTTPYEILERSKKLVELRRQRDQELLRALPQGPGSGLDADTVDGLHAQQVIDKAQRTCTRSRGGGGGIDLTHIINSEGKSYVPSGPNLQLALDDLADVGGTVWVPRAQGSKALILDDRLESDADGITLQGVGHATSTMRGVTIIKAKDNMGTTGMAYFANHNICVRDIFFHGNYQGNASGNTAVIITGEDCSVENTCFMFMRGNGLAFNCHAAMIKNAYAEYCTGNGFKLRGGLDSYGLNSYYGLVAYGNTGSGFQLDRAEGDMFLGCESWVDKQHGFLLQGAQRNSFKACHVFNSSQETNNTYDGFHLESYSTTHCLRNSIQAIIWASAAKKHKYGIREADNNQDYNIVASGTIVSDAVTAAISLQGGNSIKSADVIES